VDDVEERLVPRAQQPVRKHVRVRIAPVARHGVHGFDVLGSHLEQQLMRARDDLVLVDAGAQHPVDLLVDGVDEAGRLVEQRDLLGGLDLACLEDDARPVGDVHARALQRLQGDEVRHVYAERLAREIALPQLVRDSLGKPIGDPRLDRHRPPHRRDAGAEVLRREPGCEQLVMACRGPEVPEDRVVPARQQREPGVLVARPLADVGARDVPDVVGIEEQERAKVGRFERGLRTVEPLTAETGEIDPLFPVNRPRRVGGADRPASHRHR